MIDEKKKAEASLVIRQAVDELETCYNKIKKSQKILKFRDDGALVTEIYTNILACFTLTQILEYSAKNKMIENETNQTVPRKQRFMLCVQVFIEKLQFLYKQHLEHINDE